VIEWLFVTYAEVPSEEIRPASASDRAVWKLCRLERVATIESLHRGFADVSAGARRWRLSRPIGSDVSMAFRAELTKGSETDISALSHLRTASPYGSFSNLIASTPARSGAWFCPTAKRRRTV
jgi:hypothetical protein